GGGGGGAELRWVPEREGVEDEVVVRALEREGRGEDEVGVARRLVEVEVDRDHVVEAGERAVEAGTVRRREDRIARARHEGPDLAPPLRLDLLREHGHPPLPPPPREAPPPAPPPVQVAPVPHPVRDGDPL